MVTSKPRGELTSQRSACSTRIVLDRVGDRWSMMICAILGEESLRFGELRSRIGNIANKVLAESLRSLERDGLIDRRVEPTRPPRVEYSITQLGVSLLECISELSKWAECNMAEMIKARMSYDTHQADASAS